MKSEKINIGSENKRATINWITKAVLIILNLSFILLAMGTKAERDVPMPSSATSEIRSKNDQRAEK